MKKFHFVHYSPRGFANEVATVVFDSATQKATFQKCLFDGVSYPGAKDLTETTVGKRAIARYQQYPMTEELLQDQANVDCDLIPDSYLVVQWQTSTIRPTITDQN